MGSFTREKRYVYALYVVTFLPLSLLYFILLFRVTIAFYWEQCAFGECSHSGALCLASSARILIVQTLFHYVS